MQNHPYILNIVILLFLILTSIKSQTQIDPQQCNYYYSQQNLPIQCISTRCQFNNGLQELINNKSLQNSILCINLSDYNIQISYTNTSIDYTQYFDAIYILGNTINITNNYQLICYGNLILLAKTNIILSEISLAGSKIYLLAQYNITIIGTNLTNQSIIPTQCSCTNIKIIQSQCKAWNFSYIHLFSNNSNIQDIHNNINTTFNISRYFSQISYKDMPNNSITIVGQNLVTIEENSNIKYSIVGVFSQNVQINFSRISTSGLGYASDSGKGCGIFDQVLNQLLGCMGSGGSHGGFGGSSAPQNCYLLVSRQPYDSIKYPIQPGSGGGFFLHHSKQSSSGGGVINIQAQNISLFSSQILAQGKNGIQGGGGGAGGTISIDYNQISSNLSNISASGGNGDKMSSSGSGGRIRMWNHMWRYQNQTNIDININVLGGVGCKFNQLFPSVQLSCGENGSIFTSPCKPGTQLSTFTVICTPCPLGTYQLTYGYSRCISCTPKPNNSTWQPNIVYNNKSISYQNACNYTCDQGFSLTQQGTCQTTLNKFFQQIYAKDIFISLGMIGAAILIYLLIILVRKLKEQQILSFDNPSLIQAYRKKFFRLQDLPYHEIRLYLTGENHPFNPWKITQASQNNFKESLKNPMARIIPSITRVIRQINKKAQFSRWQKFLVTALRYSYYPLSRIILSSMRKTKARVIFQQVDKFNKKIPQSDSLGIKFHVKPQQTVASLQLFDYSRSVLDFYIQNYFPLYILLQKAPFGGYIIDFSDPFLKVFINQIVQKDESSKSIQIFLNQVNKLLKNPAKVVECLNYLWTLSDINPKYQAFLWQPTNKVLGIDRKYKIYNKQPLFLVFNSQNLNNYHFQLQQDLLSSYISQIQSLKHKFIIRKDLSIQQESNSLCIISNKYKQKYLILIFGILTTIFLILAVSTLFLNIFILAKPTNCQFPEPLNRFMVGFVIYFALWPLCDFAAVIMNYTSIFTKSQYLLADAISFNLITVIKSLILFICVIVQFDNFGVGCLRANQYIWLAMFLLGIINLIIQMMWRAKIITQTK